MLSVPSVDTGVSRNRRGEGGSQPQGILRRRQAAIRKRSFNKIILKLCEWKQTSCTSGFQGSGILMIGTKVDKAIRINNA